MAFYIRSRLFVYEKKFKLIYVENIETSIICTFLQLEGA